MQPTLPDPNQYPNLHALRQVLTDAQWADLFANRLAKRSATQMLFKHRGILPTQGELNRLADDIAFEMRSFRPLKERKPGAGMLL